MKVLSIFFRNEKGGFTKRLYNLYDVLTTNGDEVHFLGTESVPVNSKETRQHITKIPLVNKLPALFWAYFLIIFPLRALVIAERQKIERIVVFGPFYTVICMCPIVLRKIPCVTFIRADNMLHSTNVIRNTIFYLIDWFGLMLSSKVIFASNSLKERYVERYKILNKKIMVIPNNIKANYKATTDEINSIRQSLGVEKNEFLISSSGVFNEGKNFAFLIHSMRELAPYGVKLLLIGDEVKPNGERIKLEQIVNELDVADCVIFSGWVSDPKPLIAASNLFAFPSKHEGSPNALLEALSCGVPCLGSNIKEIEEVLKYEELLFPLGEKKTFINNILSLIKDPTFYENARELSYGRCKVFTFNWGNRVLSEIHS